MHSRTHLFMKWTYSLLSKTNCILFSFHKSNACKKIQMVHIPILFFQTNLIWDQNTVLQGIRTSIQLLTIIEYTLE